MWKRAAKPSGGDDDGDDDFEESVVCAAGKAASGRRIALGACNGSNRSRKKSRACSSGLGKENGENSAEIVFVENEFSKYEVIGRKIGLSGKFSKENRKNYDETVCLGEESPKSEVFDKKIGQSGELVKENREFSPEIVRLGEESSKSEATERKLGLSGKFSKENRKFYYETVCLGEESPKSEVFDKKIGQYGELVKENREFSPEIVRLGEESSKSEVIERKLGLSGKFSKENRKLSHETVYLVEESPKSEVFDEEIGQSGELVKENREFSPEIVRSGEESSKSEAIERKIGLSEEFNKENCDISDESSKSEVSEKKIGFSGVFLKENCNISPMIVNLDKKTSEFELQKVDRVEIDEFEMDIGQFGDLDKEDRKILPKAIHLEENASRSASEKIKHAKIDELERNIGGFKDLERENGEFFPKFAHFEENGSRSVSQEVEHAEINEFVRNIGQFRDLEENGDFSPKIIHLEEKASRSVSQEVEQAELDEFENSTGHCKDLYAENNSIVCKLDVTDHHFPTRDRVLDLCSGEEQGENKGEEFEAGTQLKELMDLCWEIDGEVILADEERYVDCPVCGSDITDLGEDLRIEHTNMCLDRDEKEKDENSLSQINLSLKKASVGVAPVIEWLKTLGLSKYEDIFIREEIDWDALQCLTEEDLLNLGISALGPRKKIVYALHSMRGGDANEGNTQAGMPVPSTSGNKLITEFFGVPRSVRSKSQTIPAATPNSGLVKGSNKVERAKKSTGRKAYRSNGRQKDVPSWCCIPGTPFRVDAFCYTRGDCSHWFLTHFHLDHYQGLTKNFPNGKIYCSSVTARLLNTKIGIAWDILHVLPLNEKITISGVGVTCVDANHCPGSIIILFEPPNGKPVLHTGDFRYCEDLGKSPILRSCFIHTLILDTTYCNPQYDFPRQESVIQFVVEAIQAEAFNPSSLFLIGSYTIGKERVFLEVARVLKKKVYVGPAKLRLLECLGLPKEDMDWLTSNEMESHVHVVPMWMIASFKRMNHLYRHYSNRFNLMIAFSPTGWSFGKGKKRNRALGRRSQQGTMIRYEVPYSEHSSFSELRDFVRLISPQVIIPSVNNSSPQAANAMVSLLTSESPNQQEMN